LLSIGEALVGSICSDTEYESDVHTLSLSGDFQATKKLRLNASFVYNNAKDTWDWSFTERTALGNVLIAAVPGRPSNVVTPSGAKYDVGAAYDSADQNNLIDGYSDLSYQQYEFTLGGTYNFTETFYTTASATYDVFDMGEEYVYGDEDGTAYYGYVGLGWNF